MVLLVHQVLAELAPGLVAYERGVALRAAGHYALVPRVRRRVSPSLVVFVDDARYGPPGRERWTCCRSRRYGRWRLIGRWIFACGAVRS